MNDNDNIIRAYLDLITEGKANPADKKGSKGKIASWNKHRNKEETRISSKTSRRQGKKEAVVEEMAPVVGALARMAAPAVKGLAKGAIQAGAAHLASRGVSNMLRHNEDNMPSEEAENEVDYRELFNSLRSDIEEFKRSLNDNYETLGEQSIVIYIIEALEEILESY